jgi:hypothetical protein
LSNMDIKKPYVSMPVWTVTYKNDKWQLRAGVANDLLRIIFEIASSVAENPVLRLDCESWSERCRGHVKFGVSGILTKFITSVTVIMISATVAARNHTRADQWSSGLRLNNLMITSLTVVHKPPAWGSTELSQ